MDVALAPAIVQHASPRACHHCGEACDADAVSTSHGEFCCHGCASVFAMLAAHRLNAFYSGDAPAGVCQKTTGDRDPGRFAILDDPAIAARLIDVDTGRIARATLSIPDIHCASCVWLLEQLWRFDPGIVRADVDLLRRTVRVEFQPQLTTLRQVVEQLAALGYEPALTADATHAAARSTIRRLYLQLGVAGFAFGNIMLFSVPHYANGGPVGRSNAGNMITAS
jgi:Cu+-exporting ATPase